MREWSYAWLWWGGNTHPVRLRSFYDTNTNKWFLFSGGNPSKISIAFSQSSLISSQINRWHRWHLMIPEINSRGICTGNTWPNLFDLVIRIDLSVSQHKPVPSLEFNRTFFDGTTPGKTKDLRCSILRMMLYIEPHKITSWWLNQPIWNMSQNGIIFPNFRDEH